MVKKPKKPHYVDNKKFLQAMIDWRETWPDEEHIPPVTDYIGECFLKIANHLAYRPNFINYTYREEMVSDGIENCLQYVKNFNPEKSSNPFAYFTQIIYYAFLRRIQREKKQTHVKNKLIENKNYESWTVMEGDDTGYSVIGFDPTIMLPDEDVYKPKKKEYVDNKKFLQAMIDWRKTWPDEEHIPPVTDYIGECFLKIANHLAYRPNFINYTYREEMVSDGIENCLQYVKNFNPEKSSNPFAYFTQIIYYAFLRRIQREKKQTHVKNKLIENKNYESWTVMEGDDTGYSVIGFDPTIMLPDEDVYKPKKKEAVKKKGLENFMEEDEIDKVAERGMD